ncbi:HNH endonuclease [bacterium D16-76]|nr:HNH endonuclease [bacterium D16-76]
MAKRRRLTQIERRTIYNLTGGRCAYCGTQIAFDDMQVDHVVPLRKGGSDTMDNMLPACRSCNHYKSTLTVEQFRKAIERMPDMLMRDSVTYKNAVRFGVVLPTPHALKFYFEEQNKECVKNND